MSQEVSLENFGRSAAENYERYFVPTVAAPHATEVVAAAALGPGERVLDIACGTGVVARLAAEAVGPTGRVAGIDMLPGMLEVARSITPHGESIDWYEATAEKLPLPDDSFDVAICQLALMIFPDRLAALREMRRVLAPGGRVVINVDGPPPPMVAVMEETLARHVNSPEVAAFMQLGWSLHDSAEIRGLLSDAGFRDVDVQAVTLALQLPAPAEFFWQYVHASPLAGALAHLDDEQRDTLEREIVAGWQPFVEDGSLTMHVRAVIATARR